MVKLALINVQELTLVNIVLEKIILVGAVKMSVITHFIPGLKVKWVKHLFIPVQWLTIHAR